MATGKGGARKNILKDNGDTLINSILNSVMSGYSTDQITEWILEEAGEGDISEGQFNAIPEALEKFVDKFQNAVSTISNEMKEYEYSHTPLVRKKEDDVGTKENQEEKDENANYLEDENPLDNILDGTNSNPVSLTDQINTPQPSASPTLVHPSSQVTTMNTTSGPAEVAPSEIIDDIEKYSYNKETNKIAGELIIPFKNRKVASNISNLEDDVYSYLKSEYPRISENSLKNTIFGKLVKSNKNAKIKYQINNAY